jgi:PAS domain S-box-containing protein
MSRDPNDQPPGGDPVAGDEPRVSDELDERYRTLVEQDLVGISLVQDAAFVYVNPRLAEIHGYGQEELLEVDPFELVPEERRDEVLSEVYRLVDGEVDEATVSGPVCRKDGGTAHVEAFLRRTEYRGEEAFLSVTVDVTERVEAERAREASEGLFRAVFENAMEGVIIADDEGAFVDASPAACEIFGLERDRLLGRSIDEFGDVELDFEGAGGPFGGSGADRSRLTSSARTGSAGSSSTRSGPTSARTGTSRCCGTSPTASVRRRPSRSNASGSTS